MLPVAIIALAGALWIALALFAYAILALLVAPLGVPGAAAVTGAIFLVVVAIGASFVRSRIEAAKRNAFLASLATSGAANIFLGLVARKPLMSLGIAGALAALLFTRAGPGK